MFGINISQILYPYAKKNHFFFFVRKSNLTRHPVYLFIKLGILLITKWKFSLLQQSAHQQTLGHDWSKLIIFSFSQTFLQLGV